MHVEQILVVFGVSFVASAVVNYTVGNDTPLGQAVFETIKYVAIHM